MDLFEAACGRVPEGIVAKLAAGRYEPEATTWVNIFCVGVTGKLVNCVAGLQTKGCDLDVELSSVRADHLIRAPHHAHGGLERAP